MGNAESLGFTILHLIIAHALQLPFLCPLCVFWYGVVRREPGLVKVGYGMLVPIAIVVAYLFHPVGPSSGKLVLGLFYLTSLLLLLNKDLLRNPGQTMDNR
mgnify:CR=1 FL=1